MYPITPFDPAALASGIIDTKGVNKDEQIVLYNSSLSCLQLTFADKTQDILPPCWARDWIKSSPMGKISYSTLFTLPLSGQPVSKLYGTLYETGEHSASLNQPLQYVQVAANTIVASLVELFTSNNMSVLLAGQTNNDPLVSIDSGGLMEVGGAVSGDRDGSIQINNATPQTISAQGVGSSGTMIVTEPFGTVGTTINPVNPFKFTIIKFNNWTNKTAFNVLIDSYPNGCFYFNFDGGPFDFMHNNSVVNGTIWSSFGTAQFGTTVQAQMNPNSAGYITSAIEAIQLQTGTSSHSGFIVFIGF